MSQKNKIQFPDPTLKLIYKIFKFSNFIFNTLEFKSDGKVIDKTGLKDLILCTIVTIGSLYVINQMETFISVEHIMKKSISDMLNITIRNLLSFQLLLKFYKFYVHESFCKIFQKLQECQNLVCTL